MTTIRVSAAAKQRIDQLRGKLMTQTGRQITQGEVLELLVKNADLKNICNNL